MSQEFQLAPAWQEVTASAGRPVKIDKFAKWITKKNQKKKLGLIIIVKATGILTISQIINLKMQDLYFEFIWAP